VYDLNKGIKDMGELYWPLICFFNFLVGKIDIGRVRLNFWDLGGQEELQSLWDKVNLLIDCCSSEKYFTYIHAYFIYNVTTTKHHRYTSHGIILKPFKVVNLNFSVFHTKFWDSRTDQNYTVIKCTQAWKVN